MKQILRLTLIFCLLPAFVLAQKQAKIPSNINDGFVLEFNQPFDRLYIDTDENYRTNPEFAIVLITPQTKLENYKGKPIAAAEIRPGMKVKIQIDKNNPAGLVAKEVKLRTNPEDRDEDVDGYLDRVEDSRAVVDGRTIEIAPNVVLIGNGEWKGKTFKSFSEIPLGSLVDVKGKRQQNGVILISKGETKPNLFTPTEQELVKLLQTGLSIPPPDKLGAGIKVGDKSYKVVEDLEVNTYVNKVGMRIVPRFLRYLPPEDPNKILFRFYVLEDDLPNAMAFSDGSVLITTGMLKRLENEAQLAIILGHEIAHVTNEHTRRRFETQQKQAFWISLAGAAAGTVLGAAAGSLIAVFSYVLVSNKFSRDLEDQADRIGLYYAFEAGYDVREAPKVWRVMMNGKYNPGETGNVLYSDHPGMLERLRNSRREVISNYLDADFREAITGRDQYLNGLGVYFSWIQPKPILTPDPPKPKDKKATSPKNTKPKSKKKVSVKKKRP